MSELKYVDDERSAEFFRQYPSRKLNLGSGSDIRPGYTNVDMHDYGQPNTMVGEITDLSRLPSSNFDEIIAQDILEHIRFRETLGALFEWNRLLATGGRLYIRSTYLNGLVRLFELPENQSIKRQLLLLTNLFSRQLVPGDYHFTAFTEPLIRFYLWASHFGIESIAIKDGWIFEVWAIKQEGCCPLQLISTEPADSPFLEAAYTHVLGRQIDASGRETFTNLIHGGMSRADITRTLWLSDEHQSRLADACPV